MPKRSTLVLALCTFCVGLQAAAAIPTECRGSDCGSSFSCQNVRKCICSRSSREYQLACARDGDFPLLPTVLPSKYLNVQCVHSTTASDFGALAGLKVGPVEEVIFDSCPLPPIPISELLSSFDISGVTEFHFRSHRNLSGGFDASHLDGLGNVTKLVLGDNNVTDLSGDFLRRLPRLTWLDLQGNSVRLPRDFFRPAPDLEILQLGSNKLTELDPELFSDLNKLKLLNLWNNNLTNLSRGLFAGLTGLEQLDVSSNSIASVPGDVFRDLKNLKKLSIQSNNFTNLPEDLLSGNENLETVRLHDNRQRLILPERIFGRLPHLQEVHLMNNHLTSLPENIFWGSPALIHVSFRENFISEIPQLLFRDQKNLQSLDISNNELEYLPDNAFVGLERLQSLKLGYNKLKRITREVFYGLNNLVALDMEHNHLHFMDSESLTHLPQLRTARFSHNKLTFLQDDARHGSEISKNDSYHSVYSPFRSCGFLENLELSNNSITDIFLDWSYVLLNLHSIDLSYNKIESIAAQEIHFLASNLSVDLRHNNISVINLNILETIASEEHLSRRPNVHILLEGNPLNCDCRSYEFFRYLEQKLNPTAYVQVILVPGDLRCHAPDALRDAKVDEVNLQNLTCDIEDPGTCPKGCDCKFRRYDLELAVNCTDRGLTEVPRSLPVDARTNHTVLLLDNNRIEELPNSTYSGYDNVTDLRLSSNNISGIDIGFLPRRLRVLALNDNNLTWLRSDMIRFLSEAEGMRILALHNNPWVCNCSTREFLDLIQRKYKEIPFLSNLTCSGSNEQLSKLSVSDLCPLSMTVMVSCLVAAIISLLVGSLAAFYYRYQREVKVWLYSRRFCLWFVTEEELDRDKLYDAFVSYSHKDESFVVNTLVPELESGENPFKLCLHYRDWIAGEWIPNQIARSVENSRRTLVILSPNFLDSVWSRMEFRAAHKQALTEGRARVIVVLYGDVGQTEDLDPELRAYISMNTYVKWGDPWFWRKLKYALPHPPSLVKTNFNFIRRRSVKLEKNHIDDKLELIHKLDPSGTPPCDGLVNGNAVHEGKMLNPLS